MPRMQVPALDLAAELAELRPELDAAWARVLESGRFIQGPEVEAFEQEAADHLGAKHAVALNSGTDALIIALRLAGVGPGDEVITTPFSFFATAETVLLLGAVPVFVDLLPGTFLIDPAAVAAAVGERSKAILPVHLYGELADMGALRRVAQSHGLSLIEDAAQAFGARVVAGSASAMSDASLIDRAAGTLGQTAAFSFYPTKNLGAYGDGGMLSTDDGDLAARARRLRNHGSEQRYHHQEPGYNSRLDAIQAAVLRSKLRRLTDWTVARQSVAARYDGLLAGMPGLRIPKATPGHVYHQYTVRIEGGRRDAAAAALQAAGVSTTVYYPHTLERYGGRIHSELAHAHAAAAEVLSLPIYPSLSADAQAYVATTLGAALA